MDSGLITIDCNNLQESDIFELINETLITVYISGFTGSHENHEIQLFCKPHNDAPWSPVELIILGEGNNTITIVTKFIKLKVITLEGRDSIVTAYIKAK